VSDFLIQGNEALDLAAFAKTLTAGGQNVGVLRLTQKSLKFCFYSSSEAIAETLPEENENDFYTRLTHQLKTLGHLLIHVGSDLSCYENRLGRLITDVCVFTTPERDALVRSYQIIKSIKDRSKSIGLFIANVEGFSVAQSVFRKIADTARDHLGLEIENYGYPLYDEGIFCYSPEGMELTGDIEKWFGGLEKWLLETNPTESSGEKITNEIPATFEPNELKNGSVAEPIKDTIQEKEPVPQATQPSSTPQTIQTSQTSQSPKASQADDLRIIDIEDHKFFAEAAGNKILLNSSIVKDSLHQFLQAAGFDCARFEDGEGKGTLILVLSRNRDTEGLDWVLEQYPKKEDRLIVVSDQAIGRMERSRWTKYFAEVDLRRMIRGQFGGRSVYILE
jgi:hypothetical protein